MKRTLISDLIQFRGSLTLPLPLGKEVTVYGGPFENFDPTLTRGICLAPEVSASRYADVLVPTKDFGVPKVADVHDALNHMLDFLLARHPVYVGCMAGIGRTGTFLACFAKLMGEKNPINTVRARYYRRAVETQAQERFVDSLTFPLSLRFKAARLKASAAIFGGSAFGVVSINNVPVQIKR